MSSIKDEIKFLVGSDFLHTGTAKKLELDTVDIEKVEIMRFIDEGSEIEFRARIVGFDNTYWVVKYNRNTRNVLLKRFENTMATNVHLHYDPDHNKEYVSRYEYDLLKYEMQKGEEYNVFLLLAMQDRGWFKGKRELEKWEYYFNRCEVKE